MIEQRFDLSNSADWILYGAVFGLVFLATVLVLDALTRRKNPRGDAASGRDQVDKAPSAPVYDGYTEAE